MILRVLGVLACSLTFALGALWSVPAAGHSELLRSSPADGQRLETLPKRVRLVFVQPVLPELSTIELRGPDGDHPADGLLADDTSLVGLFAADPEAEGAWTLDYRAVAADGHTVSGSVEFLVGSQTEDASDTSVGGLLLLTAVGVLLAATWSARVLRVRAGSAE